MKIFWGVQSDRGLWSLLVLAGLASALWVAQPLIWGYVFDVASAFRDRQTQQAQLVNTQNLVEDVREIDPPAQALFEQTAAAFPRQADAPQIVERLEAVADGQGLTLRFESIREDTSSQARRRQLIPLLVNLSVSGPPASLLTFLERVEHMQELTQVEEWKMTAVTTTVPGKVYRLDMRVRFFLQPAV